MSTTNTPSALFQIANATITAHTDGSMRVQWTEFGLSCFVWGAASRWRGAAHDAEGRLRATTSPLPALHDALTVLRSTAAQSMRLEGPTERGSLYGGEPRVHPSELPRCCPRRTEAEKVEHAFKAGDRVRGIKLASHLGEGTVMPGAAGSSRSVLVKFDSENDLGSVNVTNLELVPAAEAKPERPSFKVGDRVRGIVLAKQCGEGSVVELQGTEPRSAVVLFDREYKALRVHLTNLELVAAKEPTTFKVGDRVRCTFAKNSRQFGKCGTVVEDPGPSPVQGELAVPTRMDSGEMIHWLSFAIERVDAAQHHEAPQSMPPSSVQFVTCPDCKGSKRYVSMLVDEPCRACNGKGVVA